MSAKRRPTYRERSEQTAREARIRAYDYDVAPFLAVRKSDRTERGAMNVYGIYSVKHGYLANQGDQWWWQTEPTGSAIVTDDQDWLHDTRDYAQERFGTFCYIKIVPSKDGGKA